MSDGNGVGHVHRIRVEEPGVPARHLNVGFELLVGRDCEGLVLNDDAVSRTHLRLEAAGDALFATDLESTNGTHVNGVLIAKPTPLVVGDVVQVGDARIIVESLPGRQAARPIRRDMESNDIGAASLRFRSGTAGARIAATYGSSVVRARRRLAGFGSEPTGVVPAIYLVDPFPAPGRTHDMMVEGTILNVDAGEIWMVATPEAPPERPERPLALFFGAGLPAAPELELLIEGYGLHVADVEDPTPKLKEMKVPALDEAEGQLRPAMAVAFVRFLITRTSEEDFLRFLNTAEPGRVDASAQQTFGFGLGALEERWRNTLTSDPDSVKTSQFVRLGARYLRPYMWRELETFFYALVGLVFTVVFPFATKRLFDKAIPSGQFSQVLSLVSVLGAVLGVSLLAGLRRAYSSALVSSGVVRQLRNEMFSSLQQLSSGWFNRRQQGDVLSRMFADVGQVETGLSMVMRDGLVQILSLVVSSAVLLKLNLGLAIIVLIGGPVIAIIYRTMAAGARSRSRAVQEETGSLFTVAAENYDAQPVVKAFSLEQHEVGRFKRASDLLFRREVRMSLYGGLFGLSVNMVVTVLRLGIILLGAWLILHGHLTVGGLVAFLGLMGEVISPIAGLTTIGQQVQSSSGALARIREVLDAVPDIADDPEAATLGRVSGEIRFQGVSFSYTGDRETLSNLYLRIPAGSRVALVGPSGAGKSSVLQLLMRFYDPSAGAVTFDGRDARSVTLDSLRGQMGVVFQESFLFDITIAENIALGKPGATRAEIEAAAKAAELHDFVAALPQGYDTVVGERGARLSGGQRQRLAIARALVRDPAILVLDEATSALDPRTERLISATLNKVAQGRTTVAVTHRLTSITDYDHIFVLVEGKLAEEGTHEELVAAGGVYAGLWSEQTGGVVAREAAFDAIASLSRIPFFGGLNPDELATVAADLSPANVAPGDSVPEGGSLYLVRQGRAQVLGPGLGDDRAVLAELHAGDAFGVSAILGRPLGAVLQAMTPMQLMILDDAAIGRAASRSRAVADALVGEAPTASAPKGGTELSRMTLGPMAAVAPRA